MSGAAFTIVTHDEADTRRIARALGRRLTGGDVLALDGPLGAGKTTFVRGLAEGLGVDPDTVSSPTFVLCHEHAPDAGLEAGPVLLHLDAYRLGGADELETLGWEEMIERDDAVIVVEWAERVADALPPDALRVTLGHLGPNERELRFAAPASKADRLDGLDGRDGRDAVSPCPTCGKDVPAETTTAPFCSSRCRMVDLGRWFTGTYRVSRPVEESDEWE